MVRSHRVVVADLVTMSDAKAGAAPPVDRSRSVFALMMRTVFARILGVLRSFVVLPLITPGDLGSLRYLLTLTSYTGFFHGGAISAYGMHYPQWIAAERRDEAHSVQVLAFQAVLAGGLIAATSLSILFWFTRPVALWIGFVAAFAAAVQLLQTYVAVSFRVRNEFEAMAKNDTIVMVVAFVGSIVGAYFLGIGGLMLAMLLAWSSGVFFARRHLAPATWTRIDWAFVKRELPYGAILTSTSILTQVSFSIDLVFIKPYFPSGDDRYGYYAFGATIANVIYQLMDAFAQVQANRMFESYGRGSIDAVIDEMEACAARESIATMLAASLCAIGLAVAIPLGLPRYRGALPIIGLFLWAAVILRLRIYPGTLLNLVRGNRWSNVASATAIAVTFVHVAIVHWKFHDSLPGFAACSAVAYVFMIVIGGYGAYRAVDRLGRLRRFAPKILVITLPAAAFGFLFLVPERWQPHAYVVTGVVAAFLTALFTSRFLPNEYRGAIALVAQRFRRR